MNNYIFTDIDGCLNPHWKKKWSKSAVSIYNRICNDFNLKSVISSTWRTNHSKERLQEIFIEQGITIPIHDFTPNLQDHRGIEIDEWLRNNDWDKYIVIDDSVQNIIPYVGNVVKCLSYIGLEERHYDEIKLIMEK